MPAFYTYLMIRTTDFAAHIPVFRSRKVPTGVGGDISPYYLHNSKQLLIFAGVFKGVP